jgi:hypothetical protein
MIKKGSVFEVERTWVPRNTKTASLTKAAEELKIESEMPDDLVFSDDYVYSTVRAISARVNMNMDGFMREELLGTIPSWLRDEVRGDERLGSIDEKFGYRTFIGKNNHVDHYNQPEVDHGDDFLNAKHHPRGKILWAWYEENPMDEDVKLGRGIDPVAKLAGRDCWVKLLIANDRNKFPMLCRAIEDGIVTKVSMGAEVLGSTCSVCGKFAGAPWQYCDHIRFGRGQEFEAEKTSYFVDQDIIKQGSPVVAFENNHGLQFFEESWILDIQADPTAVIMDLIRGEPGTALKSINSSKTAGQRDYKQILLDLINSESEMKESDVEKVASILNKTADPNVNVNFQNLDNILEKDLTPGDETTPFNPRIPPHEQPGEHYPDLPFPCSARKEASDANPEYPLDPTIDVKVCKNCVYNRSFDKDGAVDCAFDKVVNPGGSDPLPPGFEAADAAPEDPQTSGLKDDNGNDIKEFPGLEHPPRENVNDNARLSAFYRLQSMLDIGQGTWKVAETMEVEKNELTDRPMYPHNREDDEVDTFEHSIAISIPSNQIDGKPIDPEGRAWVIDSVKKVMSREFGGVDVKGSEGGWMDKDTYHPDDKVIVESATDDLEKGTDFIKDLAFALEDAFSQYAIEFFIDGKRMFTRSVH